MTQGDRFSWEQRASLDMKRTEQPEPALATVVLPGHQSTEAELLLAPYSRGAWLFRSSAYFAHWIGATVVTAIVITGRTTFGRLRRWATRQVDQRPD